MSKAKGRAKLSLTVLLNIVFIYYLLTGIAADVVYVFIPQYYNTILYALGIFAFLFIVLSFIYALREKDKAVIMLFVLLGLLLFVGGGFLG